MLKQRILTALVLAPLAIALILFLPTSLFALMGTLIALLALWEWSRLSGMRRRPLRVIYLIVAAAAMACTWFWRTPAVWWTLVIAGVVWWLALSTLWLRNFVHAAAPTRENTALKLLAGLLIVLPAWTGFVLLHEAKPRGPAWTLLCIMVIWGADIGAYFCGRQFGRRKLAPRISPGKTWAGVYGALLVSVAVALAGGWLLGARGPAWLGLVPLAIVTVAVSIIGDLFESMIKRHAAVKDSGALFPGHGGLLDRLDSVFAALPVFALGKVLLGL